MLRKWVYRDYYHENATEVQIEHLRSHVGTSLMVRSKRALFCHALRFHFPVSDTSTDHCIDFLRQSAMCHADASLVSFEWDPLKEKPMFNASEAIHSCVDWTKMVRSVDERVVTEEEISRLQNPLMRDQR